MPESVEDLSVLREEIDFELQLVRVTHSIVRSVEGDLKTPASKKPVPLPPLVVEELKKWQATSLYRSKKDFLFPSIQKNGEQPLQPDMILRRHLRPALERMGVKKTIGWHSFRHGMSNLLRHCGVDIKVAQELLRHANPRITMEIYQQTITPERREAKAKAFDELLTGNNTHFSRLSSVRTLPNPRKVKKEEVKLVIN